MNATMTTVAEAVRDGLAEELRRDERVWVLGEDVQRGGIYGTYAGLFDEFGAGRIVNTPISEAMIVGVGLGAALAGTRPVVELRIADFALCAWDEIVNQIAKARFMFGGQARVPIVLRMPQGVWRFSAAQHSQSIEAWLAHTPGFVVLAPSSAADSKGLLKAAIRCDDPVVLFEPKTLWRSEGDVPEGDHVVPIGKARTLREGGDVTVVTYSNLVPIALDAAAQCAARGIEAEVIDLRSIWPWDREAVGASVRKTGRAVVAHESVRVGGFGAEVAATIAEDCGSALRGYPVRVGAPRAPVGYSPPLEEAYRVNAAQIVAAIDTAMRA